MDKCKRFLVFGDIHGMYDKLIDTWNKVNFNPDEDKLLFLGDYIDRGPDSIKCLEFVKDKVDNYGAIALMGNHEQMMLDYIDSMGRDEIWVYPGNGGNVTNKLLHKLPEEKWTELIEFARSLKYYYEMDNYIFCHAGLNLSLGDNWRDDWDSLVWIREKFLLKYKGDKTVVVGHTPVQAMYSLSAFQNDKDNGAYPLMFNNIIMMDTGSFLDDGKISCIDILTKEVY